MVIRQKSLMKKTLMGSKELSIISILLITVIYIFIIKNIGIGSYNSLRTLKKMPKFYVEDISGTKVSSKDLRDRISYIQFIGVPDDNNILLAQNVCINWSHLINTIIFVKKKDLSSIISHNNIYKKAIIISEKYQELSRKYNSSRYGKHYIFGEKSELIFSRENDIEYEEGVKSILNKALLKKEFRAGEHIKKEEYIYNIPEFYQVADVYYENACKYLLVGMIYILCDFCDSNIIIQMFDRINKRNRGEVKTLLIVSRNYENTDIDIMKSQLGDDIPIFIASEFLNSKWEGWINDYSKQEANALIFLIDSLGKITEVLDTKCSGCEKIFWEKIKLWEKRKLQE